MKYSPQQQQQQKERKSESEIGSVELSPSQEANQQRGSMASMENPKNNGSSSSNTSDVLVTITPTTTTITITTTTTTTTTITSSNTITISLPPNTVTISKKRQQGVKEEDRIVGYSWSCREYGHHLSSCDLLKVPATVLESRTNSATKTLPPRSASSQEPRLGIHSIKPTNKEDEEKVEEEEEEEEEEVVVVEEVNSLSNKLVVPGGNAWITQ
ncbi:hypothetical protein M0804_000947 [Polistes exclamans]|nr:hypothetical protein M0804_000947 [Polistes exclamans]